jgi:hypothetical protein
MKRSTRVVVAKGLLFMAAGVWHAWLVKGAVVGVLWGLLPYFLFVLAWDFIGTWVLLLPTLVILIWSDINVGLGYRQSASSTGAVALGLQALFACVVVGVATLIAAFVPARHKRRYRERS